MTINGGSLRKTRGALTPEFIGVVVGVALVAAGVWLGVTWSFTPSPVDSNPLVLLFIPAACGGCAFGFLGVLLRTRPARDQAQTSSAIRWRVALAAFWFAVAGWLSVPVSVRGAQRIAFAASESVGVVVAWIVIAATVSTIVGALSAAVLHRLSPFSRSRWQAETARCPACGYDLVGLTAERCPECGEPAPAQRG